MFKKHASRVGCQSTKIMFSVNVKSVILPLDTAVQNGAILSVCFERGGKISSTSNKEIDVNANKIKQKDGTFIICFPVEERVELIATMYKDTKTNQYQEKSSKLLLRQLKKNSVFNLDSYKGLGIHNLSLSKLANDMGFDASHATSTLRLPLDLLPVGYYLEVVIAATVLKTHNSYTDDNRSVMSSLSQGSDVSMIGASFDNTSGKSAVSPGAASFSRGGDGSGHSLFQQKKFGASGKQDYMASNYSLQEISEGEGPAAEQEEEEEDYDISTLQLDPEKIEYCSEEVRVAEESHDEEEPLVEEAAETEVIPIETGEVVSETDGDSLSVVENAVTSSVSAKEKTQDTAPESSKQTSPAHVSSKQTPRSQPPLSALPSLQPPDSTASPRLVSSSSSKSAKSSKSSKTNPNTPNTVTKVRVATSRAMSVDTAKGAGRLFDSEDDVTPTPTSEVNKEVEKDDEVLDVTYDEQGQIEVDKKLLSWNVTKGDTPRDRQRKKAANREAFSLYTTELANKNKRIHDLETELRQQSRSHGLQVLDLQTKLTVAQKNIASHRDKERNSRDILTAAYDKSDSRLAEQLSSARDETAAIAAEYARTAAELQLATNDVLYYKALSESAIKEKNEEMANAQEAATVAVKACLRRADLLQENEDLLEELIDTKVKFANAAYELDAELRKNLAAKKRLQYYAEQFAALEIKYMHSTDSIDAITPADTGEGSAKNNR